jgi:hypothetical protein
MSEDAKIVDDEKYDGWFNFTLYVSLKYSCTINSGYVIINLF